MNKTDFQEELIKAQREQSAEITDEKALLDNMKVLRGMVALSFNDLDISAMMRMLSSFLIHSEDCDKDVVAEKANEIAQLLDYIAKNQQALSVIEYALEGFFEGVNEEKTGLQL